MFVRTPAKKIQEICALFQRLTQAKTSLNKTEAAKISGQIAIYLQENFAITEDSEDTQKICLALKSKRENYNAKDLVNFFSEGVILQIETLMTLEDNVEVKKKPNFLKQQWLALAEKTKLISDLNKRLIQKQWHPTYIQDAFAKISLREKPPVISEISQLIKDQSSLTPREVDQKWMRLAVELQEIPDLNTFLEGDLTPLDKSHALEKLDKAGLNEKLRYVAQEVDSEGEENPDEPIRERRTLRGK